MRVAVISDTHFGYRYPFIEMVPECDVLIHCGDATMKGAHHEYFLHKCKIEELFTSGRIKHFVYVGGNHDFNFDHYATTMFASLPNSHYLHNSVVEIDGVVFFGFPNFEVLPNWAFNLAPEHVSEMAARVCDALPDRGDRPKVDVLVTHCPPFGILDEYDGNVHGGSPAVLDLVTSLRPFYHTFGHIHDAPGVYDNGVTKFVNASSLDRDYNTSKPRQAVTFEISRDKWQCKHQPQCQTEKVTGIGEGPVCTL
jgi:Icc-related predicted phosphoesterase